MTEVRLEFIQGNRRDVVVPYLNRPGRRANLASVA